MSWIRLAVIALLSGSGVLMSAGNNCGFGYELIIGTLEAMQNSLKSLTAKVNQYEKSLSKLEDQLIDHKIATVAKIEQLKDVIVGEPKCPDFGSNGTYQLKLPFSDAFEVYCEDGWIMIHRRFDGSLDFNRPWIPYREGFGDLGGEHWLGLEKMHRITRTGSYELLVILKSFSGVVKTAKYEGFRIGSETEQYQLNLGKLVGGDAGDSFTQQNTMKFSTSDQDNDKISRGSCAQDYKSGWWFNKCHWANLNGLYNRDNSNKQNRTLSWYHFNKNFECLKEARMMIRVMRTKN